jgi:competence protein ComGC
VADPEICHGKPTFKGTRIMVWQVLDDVADGRSWEFICGTRWGGRIPLAAVGEAVRLSPMDSPQTAVKVAIVPEAKKSKVHRATGFTLTQMMAVVGLILLLAVITTPFGVYPRCCTQEEACIANMRVIVNAKRQWALDHHKSTNDTPVGSDLAPYTGRGAEGELPVCPNDPAQSFDTSYNPQKVGTAPTCKIEPVRHVVPRYEWLYDIKLRAKYEVENGHLIRWLITTGLVSGVVLCWRHSQKRPPAPN